MPVTLTIDPERRLTITTGTGIVTDAELIQARRELLNNPEFNPCFDRIWDFYGVTEARVSDKVGAQLVAESPANEKPICRAVVMSERIEPIHTILNFITWTRQANRRIAAFPDRLSAEKWVLTARTDLPPD